MPMTGCLTTGELGGFLADRMTDGEREAAELHLGRCRACRHQLASLYEATRPEATGPRAPRWLKARALTVPRARRSPSRSLSALFHRQVVAGLAAVLIVAFGVTAFLLVKSEPQAVRQAPSSDILRQEGYASAAPKLLAPGADAVIASEQIEFQWSDSQGADGYLFTLLSERGDIVFQSPTKELRLTLSAGQARLERGKNYFWYVSAKSAAGTAVDSEISKFALSDR